MRVPRVLRRRTADAGSWITSSFSNYTGNCVQVQGLGRDTIRVRDSKNPTRGMLSFRPAEWDAFVAGVRNGEFEPRR
jgi:hypothetical protein